MKQIKGNIYDTGEFIVITGRPDDENHNCDWMGCGSVHVLYQFRKPVSEKGKK